MYRQILDPVSGSLALTSIFAALPLLTLFVLLGVLRMAAWKASVASLIVAILVAVFVYPMPLGQSLLAGTEGAAFGFFPIMWIVINAIWIYNLTVATGHFDVLRRSFAKVSPDQRIQAIIIAFCFGSLLEALAGFGAPVAIAAVMLVALGMSPMLAASLALTSYVLSASMGLVGAVPVSLRFLLDGVQFFLVAGGMAALYRYVPNTYVKWTHAWAGGLFVAAGLELARSAQCGQ